MKEEKLYDATDLNISFEQGRLRGEKDIKDALLEWAKERREAVAKEVVIREGVRLGVDAAFEELIDKLNEM